MLRTPGRGSWVDEIKARWADLWWSQKRLKSKMYAHWCWLERFAGVVPVQDLQHTGHHRKEEQENHNRISWQQGKLQDSFSWKEQVHEELQHNATWTQVMVWSNMAGSPGQEWTMLLVVILGPDPDTLLLDLSVIHTCLIHPDTGVSALANHFLLLWMVLYW